jgi:hypothetical protein
MVRRTTKDRPEIRDDGHGHRTGLIAADMEPRAKLYDLFRADVTFDGDRRGAT